jgi:hypothetical protein
MPVKFVLDARKKYPVSWVELEVLRNVVEDGVAKTVWLGVLWFKAVMIGEMIIDPATGGESRAYEKTYTDGLSWLKYRATSP